MRILLLNTESSVVAGPSPAHVRGVASALLRAGHHVDYALCAPRGHAELLPLQSHGLTLHMLPPQAGRENLERLFAACRPDLVIERLVLRSPWAAEVAARTGTTHLYEVAGSFQASPSDARRPASAEEVEACLRRGFVASRGAVSIGAEGLNGWRALAPDDFEVISLLSGPDPAGLVAVTPECRAWAKRVLGAAANEFVIGFSGVFRPWHDLDTLELAIERLRATVPTRLVLIGDGPARNRLLERTTRHRTPAVLTGTLNSDETRAMLECCDAVAVPYARAGDDFSPLKLVEAMVAGRPIVATDTAQTRRILAESGGGLLVPAGDPAAMAAAFERLATQPELRRKLADAAGRRAAQHYSWDLVVDRVLAFAAGRRIKAENIA